MLIKITISINVNVLLSEILTNVFSSVDITIHQWRTGAEESSNYQQSLPGHSFDIVTVKVKHQVSIF